MPKVLFVLRAATVPRSTEILPLGFDWVITFLHSLRGAVGVLPGCAPFCVKAVKCSALTRGAVGVLREENPGCAPLCVKAPSVGRSALAGDPPDAGGHRSRTQTGAQTGRGTHSAARQNGFP